jgi:glycosyltransferase 2 family protein
LTQILNDIEKSAAAAPAGAAQAQKPWLRRALRVLAVLLSVLVIAGLVRALRRDGPAALAAWRTADVKWGWIALAFAWGMAGHMIYVVGWRRLLADCGVRVTLWQTARFYFASNLGRYLPAAKAWQMSIVAVMAAENQLPAAAVAATSLFQGMIGVAVGMVLLLATGNAVLGVSAFWFALPIAGIIALLAVPYVIKLLPRIRALLVSRMPGIDSVSVGTMWALVWTAAASWIAWGIALYTLAVGLLPRAEASLVAYLAAWIGPFLAGLIAVVAPAGLGVRDEMMRTMLTAAGLNSGGAIILVVVARVWTTILDVVPALFVLALRRKRRADSEK